MNPKLNLVSIERDGCVRVASTGDLTVQNFHPVLANPMEAVLGANWAQTQVLLDLKATKFIDSSAIGWLIATQREFRAHGGALAIHSIEPRVRRVLEILKVHQVVTLLENEEAARKHLSMARAA